MKTHLFFLLLLSALHSCRQNQAVTEREAIQVINKFDDGWQNKNRHIVDSVLAPAYVYFTQSGSIFSRDSVVATAGESSYILQNTSRSQRMKRCIAQIARDIEEGVPLHQALESSGIVSRQSLSLIRLGEESGHLIANMQVAAQQEEK